MEAYTSTLGLLTYSLTYSLLGPHNALVSHLKLSYNVCLEKGSNDIWSTVCDTIYTIYLSRCTQTADPISSEPFSGEHIVCICNDVFSILYASFYKDHDKKGTSNLGLDFNVFVLRSRSPGEPRRTGGSGGRSPPRLPTSTTTNRNRTNSRKRSYTLFIEKKFILLKTILVLSLWVSWLFETKLDGLVKKKYYNI